MTPAFVVRPSPNHKCLLASGERRYALAMRLASWNVNSIRVREQAVLEWVRKNEPDVLCLQETKVVDDEFPSEELLRLGYEVAAAGQPAYNGVAIASRLPLSGVRIGLADDPPGADRRLICATAGGIRVVNAYVPNGKQVGSASFAEKLRWLDRLRQTLDQGYAATEPVAVCGDFNVAREDRDVFDPERYRGRIHFHPDEQRALAGVLDFGLVDAFRHFHADAGRYSWWDYRTGGFAKNEGLRIDYVFVTPPLLARCEDVTIDVEPRRTDKPSDHAPVVMTFS